jgi:DNA-binding winged helix-turn-helix (wHTH) protein
VPHRTEAADDQLRLGPLRIDVAAHAVERDGHPIELTPTEFRLLVELARHAGNVLSREQLLERVWGYDYLGDSRLVDATIQRLRAKVEPDPSHPTVIETVRGVGYRAVRASPRPARRDRQPPPPARRVRARLVVTVLARRHGRGARAVGPRLRARRPLAAGDRSTARSRRRASTSRCWLRNGWATSSWPGDIEASGLADDLQRRGVDAFVDLGAGEDFVTGLGIAPAPEVVSDDLLALVAEGRVAAERVDLDGTPTLVVGARRPPAGPDFYFFTDLSDIDATLAQLRWVLLAASLLLLLVGGDRRLADGAARRVLGGHGRAAHRGPRPGTPVRRRRLPRAAHPGDRLVHEAAELADHVDALPAGTRRVVELLDGDVRRLRTSSRSSSSSPAWTGGVGTDDVQHDEVDVPRFLAAVAARRLPAAAVRGPSDLRVRDRPAPARAHRRQPRRQRPRARRRTRRDGRRRSRRPSPAGRGGRPRPGRARRGPRAHLRPVREGGPGPAGGGSGLGLAIVREHVRVLGGTVRARPREGGGLVVEVRLPARPPELGRLTGCCGTVTSHGPRRDPRARRWARTERQVGRLPDRPTGGPP